MEKSVCLCSFERNEPLFAQVASLPAVHDIGTDPYYTMPLSLDYDPQGYVGRWAKVVRRAAAEAGISAHVWVQGFGLAEGAEHVVPDSANAAREAGVDDVFFWGFRAAEATSGIAPDRPELVWELARETLTGAAPTAAR